MSNSTSVTPSKVIVETPTIKRRVISLLYDAFLVAAVAMLGMLVYVLLFQNMSDRFHEIARPAALIIVTAAYFIHAWTGSGHTLAMKTWRIKIVKVGFAKVPLSAAIIRYIAGWGWVLPGLLISKLMHLNPKQAAMAVSINIVLWGLSALLDRDRQLLHDKLAGTRLISLPKLAKGALVS